MTQSQQIQPTEKQIAIQNASVSIETAIKECGVMAVRKEPAFMQAVRMAHGIRMIKAALTEEFVKQNFLPLQNSALGFLTDKPDGGYPWEVVRDALCEALLRGFMPVNNEFNIISNRFYGAKTGFERIVREWPGIDNLQIDMGVPRLVADKGALVPCEARWLLDGEVMSLSCAPPKDAGGIDTSIPVRVNSGMGPDAILGKATRKLYARIYQRLTGCARDVVESENEVIVSETLPAVAAPEKDGQRIKMGGDKKAAEPRSDTNGDR